MLRRSKILFQLGVALAVLTSGRIAWAVAEFQKEFVKQYLDQHENKEYAEYVKKKVRCFVCHQGKKKTNCNSYGKQFVKLLDIKEDKKNTKKIEQALLKVGKIPSDPKNEKSRTYAQLIAAGELPGGKLEDVRKEPPEPQSDMPE